MQAQAHSHSPPGSQVGPSSVIGSKETGRSFLYAFALPVGSPGSDYFTDYVAHPPTEDNHADVDEHPQQDQDEEHHAFADETFDTTLTENGDDLHEYDDESFDDGDPNVDELANDDGHVKVPAHAPGSDHSDLRHEQDEPEFDEEDDDDLYAGDLTVQELDVDPDVHSTDSLLSIVSKTSSKRGFEEVDDDGYGLELEEGEHVGEKAVGDLSPGTSLW